jgi:hypothetical protein
MLLDVGPVAEDLLASGIGAVEAQKAERVLHDLQVLEPDAELPIDGRELDLAFGIAVQAVILELGREGRGKDELGQFPVAEGARRLFVERAQAGRADVAGRVVAGRQSDNVDGFAADEAGFRLFRCCRALALVHPLMLDSWSDGRERAKFAFCSRTNKRLSSLASYCILLA